MYPPKHFTIKNTKDSEKNNTIINEQLTTLIENNPLATLIFNQSLGSKSADNAIPNHENSTNQNNTIQNSKLHISHIPCHFLPTENNISANNSDENNENINHKNPMLVLHVSNHHPLARQLKVSRENTEINIDSNESTPTKVSLVFHGEQGYISPNDVEVEDRPAHKVPTWNYCKVHVVTEASEVLSRNEKYKLMEQSTDYFERSRDNPWLLTDAPENAIEQMLKAITFIKLSIIDIEGSFKLSQNKPLKVKEQIAEKLMNKNNDELAKQMLAQ